MTSALPSSRCQRDQGHTPERDGDSDHELPWETLAEKQAREDGDEYGGEVDQKGGSARVEVALGPVKSDVVAGKPQQTVAGHQGECSAAGQRLAIERSEHQQAQQTHYEADEGQRAR